MKIFALILSLIEITRMSSTAALFTLSFGGARNAVEFDSHYSDEESAVFNGEAEGIDLTAQLVGRNYGDSFAGDRWGVLDNSLSWNHQQPGGLIRGGFAPRAVGDTWSEVGAQSTEASYLSFNITPATETLFEGITLRVDQTLTICVAPTAWAATSVDNFETYYPVQNVGVHGQQAEWALVGFETFLDQPMEIRIYGIIGADEGALPKLSISGFASPPAVPEPSAGVFLVLGAAVALRRRR